METIKQTLFTGWYFMRWLRLLFGVIFMVQAIQMHDIMVGAIAGFFLVTAITNTGCCVAGSCAAWRSNWQSRSVWAGDILRVQKEPMLGWERDLRA